MAWSLIASYAFGQAGGSIDTTGADLIVAIDAASTGGHSCSDNKSNIWTGLTPYARSGGFGGRIFYCAAPTVGTGHTFSGSAGAVSAMLVLAFSGSNSSPVDVENGNTANSGTTTIQTGAILPSANGDLIVAATSGLDNACNLTALDSGFTLGPNIVGAAGSQYGGGCGYLIQTTAAIVNPTLTLGYAPTLAWAAGIAAFKVGSSAPHYRGMYLAPR